MDYCEARDFILGLTDYEKIPGAFAAANFDLRRMEALLAPLGEPHRSLNCIHIAGSKGKGSTAALIASALSASGYRTGLYTSPHLHTMRERLRLDGEPISREALAEMTARVKPGVLALDPLPSTFEVLTTIAFLYFREQDAHWVVLEVGLGGRLDATNVVTPLVSVITSISYDHTEVLGKTLAEIAREKAGIIKPGVPAVVAPQSSEALAVLREACQQRSSPLIEVGQEVTWQPISRGRWGQSFRVKGRKGSYPLFIPLLGDHQLENAATAVAALEVVSEKALRLTPRAIASGFASVSWEGRLQVVSQHPLIVVDGAHNADSARRLREALGLFEHQRLVLMLGTSRDKDIPGIIRELAPLRPQVILTTARHPRAASACALAEEWSKYGIVPHIAPDTPAALAEARSRAREGDLILVTGSLFLVAEVVEELGLAQREDL